MIPQKELDQLVQYYKGELTENALLNKAATLAAQKHVLLSQPNLPASVVNAKTKSISRELTKLTRRLRQFPGGMGAPGGAPGDDEERDEEEEGDLVTGPLEQWLKCMIKGTPSTPKAHKSSTGSIKKKGQASTSGSKIPVPKKAKTDTPLTAEEETDLTQRLEALRERRKTLEEKLTATGSWGKGKGKGQRQRTLGLGTIETLGWLGRLGARQKVSTPFGVRLGMRKKKQPQRKTRTRRKRPTQRGRGVDIQKWLGKTGIEFHWPGYQFMGPGTHLEKQLKRGDKGINRLDRIARQHDIDYSHAKNLQDKWKADTQMIKAIDRLPGKKTMTERVVKKIMQAKKRLKL